MFLMLVNLRSFFGRIGALVIWRKRR